MKNIKLITTALASSVLMSSCATYSTIEGATRKRYEDKVALSEQIVFVGKPKTPISSHPYAMVLAGNNHSILVSPKISATTPQDLFAQIFEKVDLAYLYISTPNKQKTLELDLGKDPVGVPTASQNVDFVFVKPTNLVKANEQKTLENLGFDCQMQDKDSKPMLACMQTVATTFTLAQKVQNVHGTPHRFKEPVVVNFTYQASHTRPSRLLLTPLALALDVVTLPITLTVAGIAIIGLANAEWH